MKARHLKRLREKLRYFNVVHSSSLFGGYMDFNCGITVLAKNHRNACERARRRGYGLSYTIRHDPTTPMWAHWMVKLADKPNNHKHVLYY